jgi:hypothetical protein
MKLKEGQLIKNRYTNARSEIIKITDTAVHYASHIAPIGVIPKEVFSTYFILILDQRRLK